MKDFKNDLDKFEVMLVNHEPFAISRNNDGEMKILFNEFINLINKENGEFIYNPNDDSHKIFRDKLIESAQYRAENYYVGIACKCCVGDENHKRLKELTNQDEKHLTWGNIFVNSNYKLFIEKIYPLFKEYDVVMVINNKAITYDLNFNDKIVKIFNIGTNAWMSDYNLIEVMKEYIIKNEIRNHLFLFAAGPFTNILIYECFKISEKNMYIDIGSTLDDIMCLGKTRGYLSGANTLNKVCIW